MTNRKQKISKAAFNSAAEAVRDDTYHDWTLDDIRNHLEQWFQKQGLHTTSRQRRGFAFRVQQAVERANESNVDAQVEAATPRGSEVAPDLVTVDMTVLNPVVLESQHLQELPAEKLRKHDIPYLLRGTVEYDAYAGHPNIPDPTPSYEPDRIYFDITNAASYTSSSVPAISMLDVRDVSSLLHKQTSIQEDNVDTHLSILQSTMRSVAVIARALLSSSTRISSALPVQIADTTLYRGLRPRKRSDICYVQEQTGPDRPTSHVVLTWMPERFPLLAAFEECPILRCSNTTIADVDTLVTRVAYEPRRYAVTWELATGGVIGEVKATIGGGRKAHMPQMQTNNLNLNYKAGWERFSSIKCLVDRISANGAQNQLHPAQVLPSQHFEVVDFRSLQLTKRPSPTTPSVNPEYSVAPDDTEATAYASAYLRNFLNLMTPVNGRSSCAFHADCIHPLNSHELFFCEFHHRIAVQYWTSAENIKRYQSIKRLTHLQYNSVPDATSQSDVSFSRPVYARDLLAIELLHNLHARREVWTIDAEFAQPGGYGAVPFQISVRNVKTEELVISATVDHCSMSLQDMEMQLSATYVGNQVPSYMRTQYLERFYNSERTSGFDLAEIGRQIREKGFKPETHVVFGWATSTDVAIFHHALRGNSMLFDPTPFAELKELHDTDGFNCLQPYSISKLVHHCSNLLFRRCGYVFRSLFPAERDLQMHDANNDTLAATRIYNLFRQVTAAWVRAEQLG